MDQVSVGVLVSAKALQRLRSNQVDRRLEALLIANHSVGTKLFFFNLKGVDLAAHKIRGTHRTPAGEWRRATFAYPQALYKRQAVTEENRTYASLLGQLRSRNTVYLNSQRQFDKWQVYQCLAQNPKLQPHLPLTWQITHWEQVLELAESNPVLYLKACRSGKGKKVLRLERVRKNKYRYTWYVNGLTRGRVGKHSLISQLAKFFGDRELIAQTAIDLVRVEERIVDFRAELQRNGSPRPQVVAIPVRIARTGSPITTHSASMALQKFHRRHPNCIGNLSDFSRRAQEVLEEVYTTIEGCMGRCGEMGVDLGLDRQGKIWIIEANSQSTKVSLLNSYPKSLIVESFRGLLRFAQAEAQRT